MTDENKIENLDERINLIKLGRELDIIEKKSN